jgi:hypothetical protein
VVDDSSAVLEIRLHFLFVSSREAEDSNPPTVDVVIGVPPASFLRLGLRLLIYS